MAPYPYLRAHGGRVLKRDAFRKPINWARALQFGRLKKFARYMKQMTSETMKRRKHKTRGKVDLRKIRTTSTYSFKEIASLFNYSIGSIRRWKAQGLPIMTNTKPMLVHGAELKAWLDDRQKARKRPCEPEEFYCFAGNCRTQRRPKIGSVRIRKSNQIVGTIEARCEACGSKIRKGYAMTNLTEIEKTFESFKGNIEDLYWRNNPPLNVASNE